MDWIKTVIYIAVPLIFLGLMPIVCVVRNKGQQFTFKIKYLGIAIYTFKYSPQTGAVNKLFAFKLGKKKDKQEQELSFDEKVKKFQERTMSKLDELSEENDRCIKLREKYADDPKKLKQIEKINRKRIKGIERKKLRQQLGILKSGVNILGKLLKRSKITKLKIDFVIRTLDAAQRAILYGMVSCIVYNSLTILKQLMKVDIKKINIQFDNEHGLNQFNGSLKYKINIICLLNLAIEFFVNISKS